MQRIAIDLPAAAPGTNRQLEFLRFGAAAARPKAYVQAALHGDELPGMLVAVHLRELLEAIEAAGEVLGEVVLVPVANPIGLAQFVMDAHLGRYDLALQTNFNREWPDPVTALSAAVRDRLTKDPRHNAAVIRAALLAEAARLPDRSENAAMRKALYGRAVDADLALDLHCDLEAVPHLYTASQLWPAAADLAAEVGARAVLLAERSGGFPFDEALSAPWSELRRRFPDQPIPMACLSATVEYRGLVDVDETLARADAEALVRFLRRRGVLAGDPGPLPPLLAEASPLEAVAMVRADQPGLVDFAVRPGDIVDRGQQIATIIDPLSARAATRRRSVPAPTSGVVFARAQRRLARAGDILCKIAGQKPLAGRAGKLLSD